MTAALRCAAVLLAACTSDPVCPPPPPSLSSILASGHEEPAPPPEAHEGLGARLAGFEYPFDVQAIALTMQGRAVEMVYMDVRPAEPRGVVLLLHGKNFSGAYWEPVIRALVAERYRVVVPDQIGFGKSSKPTEVQYSFHEMTRHTLALLDHLSIERALVVGHSMGGMLATRFALSAPNRTAGLALLNPIGLEDWQRVVPYASVETLERQELAKAPGDVRRYMQERYFGGRWDPAFDSLLTIQVGWMRGPDRERMARISALTADMIFTQPVVHEQPDLQVPTLLVIGQRDRTALGVGRVAPEVARTLGDYPALGRRAAERIPDSELIELEDVGHLPQIEAPERTLPPLLAFAERSLSR